MNIPKIVRAKDLQVGDRIPLFENCFSGRPIEKITITPRNRILVCDKYNSNMFSSALDPMQKITILVDGEPSPTVGLWEI
jgi:hypothetical protein